MTESGKQKIIRKCMLKQKRAQQRLLRDLNIEYSEDPTKVKFLYFDNKTFSKIFFLSIFNMSIYTISM